MDKRSKKGDMKYGVLVTLILGVLFLVLYTGFLGKFGEVAETSSEIEACRTSVALASQVKQVGAGGLASPLDVNCPTRKIQSDAETDDELFEELATEYYNCWYKFGEGKLSFTSNMGFFVAKDNVCFVCSIIFYDEPKIVNIDGFAGYLQKTNVPGKSFTFTEYFYGLESESVPKIAYAERWDLGQPLYVVYGEQKTGYDPKKGFFEGKLGSDWFGLWGIFRKDFITSYLHIMQAGDIVGFCDALG